MFERLAGKLLNRLLSKYFVQNHESEQRKSTQLSVWSGYISFENLEFRKDVVNELLQSSGIEMVSGSIRSLEITIPWAKLGAPPSTDDDAAVVVVVLDGVHVLLRTNYEYNDEALRQDAISSRRSALADSESYGRKETPSLSRLLHKRITEGILKDIMEKLQIHIRDVHIRLEDVQSDSANPYACGVTLESLHVQAEDEQYIEEGEGSAVIRKEGQLNHFAVYWTAIDHDEDMPVEMSVLHAKHLSSTMLAKALNKCIARRGSALASPRRAGATDYAPKHTYLLRPVNATCHAALSTKPGNLKERPSFVGSLNIDDLSIHLRDFQSAGIFCLVSAMKEHTFFKQYRPYRPRVSPRKNPRAWWRYAAKVVRMELRESRMRWSWSRFHQRYELRRRYCHLYERQCRYPSSMTISCNASSGALQSLSIRESVEEDNQSSDQHNGAPDEGAGPTTDSAALRVLSQQELEELTEIEDGIRGDLSIRDIVLYRAVVNARLAGILGDDVSPTKRSGFRRWMSSAVTDDVESEREYDRLLAYLDSASESTEVSADDNCCVAVSFRAQLERGCISLYSPLESTADQKRQYRRLHKRFMDISIKNFFTEVEIMGNFESYQLTISLDDFSTSELRSSLKEFVVLSRLSPSDTESMDDVDAGNNPLIYIQMTSDPPDQPEYDIGFHARLNAVEVIVTPESEWIYRIRDLVPSKGETSSSTFWQNVSLSQLGSLGSDRLGWLGRSARALSEHKNLDLDVRINCPVIRFGGNQDCTLMVDLGKAHLVTESLAGVAIGKLNYAYKDVKHSEKSSTAQSQQTARTKSYKATSTTERSDGSADDTNSQLLSPSLESRTVTTFPSSPKKIGMDQFFLGSAASVVGSEARGFSGRSTASGFNTARRTDTRSMHSSFYDKFQVRLSETKIYLLDRVEDREENILSDLDIAISLESSVIPSDHSLCRFKARASVNDLVVSVTQSSVLEIGNIAHAWKRSISSAGQTASPTVFVSRGVDQSFSLRHELMTEIESQVEQHQEALTDASSVVDEDEFLDVFENDGEASWSDEKWAVDAESVFNGDEQSYKSGQKRRKARSVSDVSSISDGSFKRTPRRASGVYLNAENLARLEEGGGEEDDESDLDSDDDSFHSAISFGGRIELASTLLGDIATAENEVAALQGKLSELSQGNVVAGNTYHPNIAKRRRRERQSVKVTLDRAQAELRAMKASHHDLEQTVAIVADENVDGLVNGSQNSCVEESDQEQEDIAALRAQSILRYRRRRNSAVESIEEGSPSLINVSNQEFFQGTLNARSLCVKLESDSPAEGLSSFNFQLSQLALVVSHRARDSKVFVGADFLSLSRVDSGTNQELLRGGGPSKATIFSRVVSPQVDQFLRVAFDFRHGRLGVSSKCRIILGGIEISPEASLLPAMTSMAQAIKQPSPQAQNIVLKPNIWSKVVDSLTSSKRTGSHAPLFHDLYVRCSSLRICLRGTNTPLLGAIVLTDTGVRTTLEVSSTTARLQLDTMCGNIQVYSCGDDASFAAKEFLGRKDHYGQVVRGRLRIHCTPRSEVDGWAAGHPPGSSCLRDAENQATPKELAIDCHIGIRVQPIQIVPYKECLDRFLSLRSPSVPTRSTSPKASPTTLSLPSQLAIRWRIDMAIQKASIVFPSGTSDRTDRTKMPDSALQLMLSLRLCAEHRNSDSESSPVIRAALHDISLVRSLDDWPILERAMLSMAAVVSHPALNHNIGSLLERIDAPSDSFWSETGVLLRECTTLEGPSEGTDGLQLHVSFNVSPVRLNASSSILIILLKNLASYRKKRDPHADTDNKIAKSEPQQLNADFRAVFIAPDFEVKFFKDVSSAARGGIAYARPLFSVSSAGWLVDVSGKRDEFNASVRVANFMVHDLSTHPGVRAVGLSNSKESRDSDTFLTLHVALQRRNSLPILDVRLRWGKIQLLLLPSLIDSCLSVLKDIWQMDASQATSVPATPKRTSWPPETMLVSVSFDTDGFECIVSSRNIFDYIRDGSEEPINVVTFRWASSLQGVVALVRSSGASRVDFPSAAAMVDHSKFQDQIKVIETLRLFAENQLHAMVLLKSQDDDGTLAHSDQRGVLSMHLDLRVTEFQALRTCVERAQASLSAAGDSGDTPAIFTVAPPLAGEQRITNPINFSAQYRLFGTSVSAAQHTSSLDNTELSQAFELDADMVDVLVYIRSSAGGMSDAYRITLKPIATSLNDAQRAHQRTNTGDGDGDFGKKIRELLKRATTVGSASVKGFQVTLVPGGATQLTESPIVQFVMRHGRFGFATIDVPANFEPASAPLGNTLLAISGALRGEQAVHEAYRSGQSIVSHATIAGWLNVDISAHYHNRRLVAWEPLIEQWTAEAKFGIDLVRVLSFAPSVRNDSAFVASEKGRSTPGTNFVPDAGERLRDIRRLFGSPFANKQSERGTESMVKCPSDMPYLLLVALAPSLISSALHPTQSQEPNIQQDAHQRSVIKIPGIRRMEWLKQFGHPGFTGEKRSGSRDPAIQCFFSDTKPLNINLTGALIENLATYMTGTTSTSAIIPQWIRNDTGLTIRFLEVLNSDRLRRGEKPKPTTLASGREIPLSLKRAVSQSCDPHRAQITLELGSFEETVDRVNHSKYNVSKGSRSTTFFYKAVGRIPVDTVGIHEISFYENTELLSQSVQKTTAAVGKIIVRISLKGGIKLVSIESPMVLCNATDQDLHCEVRDKNGIVQLWSSRIPKINESDDDVGKHRAAAPIPADLLPLIDAASSTLSLSAVTMHSKSRFESDTTASASPVDPPLPYSRNSISRGIISETELSLVAYSTQQAPSENRRYAKFLHLSACSLRLGSFGVTPASRPRTSTKKPTASIVPQQRMLLLRASLVVANHLPVLMHVQVRRKAQPTRLAHVSSSNLVGLAQTSSSSQNTSKESRERQSEDEQWTDLGIISCGKLVRWTGAQASQEVELKVKLLDVRDKSTEKFPSWSTVATISAERDARNKRDGDDVSSSMTIDDATGTPLSLSVHVNVGLSVNENDDFGVEDVRSFAAFLDQAPRVVTVSVPYWIVDSSGLDLEFLSNKPVAGQSTTWSQSTRGQHMLVSHSGPAGSLPCLGLADLVGNGQLDQDPTRATFEVLMIGDQRASRLTMRQRHTRIRRKKQRLSRYTSSWCEPIALQTAENAFTDIAVFPQSGLSDLGGPSSSDLEPLALRSEVVKAPSKCGGSHGTRIVHIFNRYKIINEMGRDLELIAGHGRGEPVTIEATGYPVPFHFDDSSPIRFRPKEFGWLWSGQISIMKKRREVTLRLVHKLRGQIIIANVECLASSKSPSNILVFRNATQPPFRLENHTMYAFRYGQSSEFVTDEENHNWQRSDLSLDSTLLPYQHADFAWDEPDEGRRSVSIELGDTAARGRNSSRTESKILGTFALEKIAPGSNLRLSSRGFAGQIVADGPTRVLRITDANLPETSIDGETGDSYANAFSNKEGALTVPSSIEVRLFHGIGISVVDWTPQELLYISIDDLVIERHVDATHERFSVAVGHVSVDNQLWVTPYPVLLKIGRKQAAGRRRRNQAFELGWTRALAKQGGLMLLTSLELSVDPITIRVDGAVVNDLLNMILHPIVDKQLSGSPQGNQWLEAEIRRVLRLGYFSPQKSPGSILTMSDQLPDNGDVFLATAAVAAKIQAGSRSPIVSAARSRVEPHKESSPHRQNERKLYIDKLKISNVKTEISWTGGLPASFVGLPGILRPALTFESLPVLLRSFTSYHVYGTTQDIAEGVKHHYVSVWRAFDILVGLTFKPTFLIRAFVYTTREFFASFLDTCSQWCSLAEDTLLEFIPKDMILKSSPSTSSKRKGVEQVSGLYRAIVGKPTLLMASSCRTWGVLLSSFASSLRYREPGGVLASRTRNPRLFAHVDGKELLVEYVEGENAGKALLSRVRAGQHLGEGYVFHTENVHLRSAKGDSQADVSATPLIIMVTSERVLLLNGERKANFCQVIWEALFENMVHMELDEVDGDFFYLAKFWYLIDTEQSKGNTDDRLNRFAHAIVADADLGLDMLMCKSLFVPQDLAKTLRLKITSVNKGLDESASQLNLQSFAD